MNAFSKPDKFISQCYNHLTSANQLVSAFVVVLVGSVVLLSCSGDSGEKKKKRIDPKKYEETLIKVNKQLVLTENDLIEEYVKRHRWNMEETGSGLRYMIYEEGDGAYAKEGKVAVLEYTLELLNGTRLYTSEEIGQKEFLIGKGGVESGLEEGILFLQVGDRAKFILPSHLAYGLLGDQEKIPEKAVLVYDLKLIDLKEAKHK